MTADKVEICRVCGCNDTHACEGGCSWVAPNICSRCGSKCKGCDKIIVWGVTPDGKKIPLDPRADCYAVTKQRLTAEAVRMRGMMVNHFATCPKADKF